MVGFCWCLMSTCLCGDCADKKVFLDFFVLGWYSTGSDVHETDMLIHKAVSTWNHRMKCLICFTYILIGK
jgi:hypothetical protein